jgi:DNA-binding CsgD family transcriptional regulator
MTYRHPSRSRTSVLTYRQLEVLRLMANGYESKEIARLLSIKPQTVKFHRTWIFRTLEASNAPAAVAIALRSGLIA